MKTNRAIIIVLDSVGIGELPDAEKYGDAGSNTLGHIAKAIKGFDLPNLRKIGLGNIGSETGFESLNVVNGAFGKSKESSPGKDTTTGHWEIGGLILQQPFPVFLDGFPAAFIDEFEKVIGKKTIGNFAASGTEIIDKLGPEHIQTGMPIVYTSADSVFQIAAHEEIIPVDELYSICKTARKLLTGSLAVGRVIARPFIGVEGSFTRTHNRKDFSLFPPGKTMMDLAKENNLKVQAVGKIEDIYAAQGVTHSVKTKNNDEGVNETINAIKENFSGIIMTNLVDFDMNFGHRRDVKGYANALIEFDIRLPEILSALKPGDVLIITADHGNDPTAPGSDHTREHIPILIFGNNVKAGINIGTRETFADIGATVCEMLELPPTLYGKSFWKEIKN